MAFSRIVSLKTVNKNQAKIVQDQESLVEGKKCGKKEEKFENENFSTLTFLDS